MSGLRIRCSVPCSCRKAAFKCCSRNVSFQFFHIQHHRMDMSRELSLNPLKEVWRHLEDSLGPQVVFFDETWHRCQLSFKSDVYIFESDKPTTLLRTSPTLLQRQSALLVSLFPSSCLACTFSESLLSAFLLAIFSQTGYRMCSYLITSIR